MSALARSVNERKEPDALGIFVEITSPSKVFAGVQPWSLALQKSGESLVLADIPVYLDKSVFFLEKLKSESKQSFFTKSNFNKLFDLSRSNGTTSTKYLHSDKP